MKTFLKILGLFIAALLAFWFCAKASGQSQGDGARDLISPQPRVLSIPALIVPTNPPGTDFITFFFAATATSTAGLVSDFSNQVSTNYYETSMWTNVILVWEKSASTNIKSYTLHGGGQPGIYTNSTNVGAALSGALTMIVYPVPLTNVVLNVTTTGTNLYRAPGPRGPWTAMNLTNYTATNPPGPVYFRGRGKTGNRVNIRSWNQ
jgi:hypothetical protein